MRNWLKTARQKRGYTMLQISEKLGISESYYCAIESGARQKRMDMALAGRIAAVLGVGITTIVRNEAATSKE